MSEHDFEPTPGLPEQLPEGERILWQGSPDWREFALHVFHVRKMTFYFAAMLTANVAHSMSTGASLLTAISNSRGLFVIAALALGVLLTLAYFSARTTIYTLTDRRVVLRHGMALPMSVNLPFNVINAAAVKRYPNGVGDISMTLARGQRIGYLLTWPHVRRWHLMQPQPSLRCIADVTTVAQLFTTALGGTTNVNASLHETSASPALHPAHTAAA